MLKERSTIKKDIAPRDLRWGVERRLEFAEFRIVWDGRLNRNDITEFFGISTPQAAADISRYQELAPNNITYDKSAKCYVKGKAFKPVFLTADAQRYLAQLQSITDGILTSDETWISRLPSFDAVPVLRREIKTDHLSGILEAIHSTSAINIKYQSMTQPEPAWRWIFPHALGFDGFRWHTRAYCYVDNIFKDFLLPRIQGVRGIKDSEIDSKSDEAWHSNVTVQIGPHPDLNENQKRVVEVDYGMTDGALGITTRKAFLYYVLKRFSLDLPVGSRSAKDQHIVLLNSEEIDDALAVAEQRKVG